MPKCCVCPATLRDSFCKWGVLIIYLYTRIWFHVLCCIQKYFIYTMMGGNWGERAGSLCPSAGGCHSLYGQSGSRDKVDLCSQCILAFLLAIVRIDHPPTHPTNTPPPAKNKNITLHGLRRLLKPVSSTCEIFFCTASSTNQVKKTRNM